MENINFLLALLVVSFVGTIYTNVLWKRKKIQKIVFFFTVSAISIAAIFGVFSLLVSSVDMMNPEENALVFSSSIACIFALLAFNTAIKSVPVGNNYVSFTKSVYLSFSIIFYLGIISTFIFLVF